MKEQTHCKSCGKENIVPFKVTIRGGARTRTISNNGIALCLDCADKRVAELNLRDKQIIKEVSKRKGQTNERPQLSPMLVLRSHNVLLLCY